MQEILYYRLTEPRKTGKFLPNEYHIFRGKRFNTRITFMFFFSFFWGKRFNNMFGFLYKTSTTVESLRLQGKNKGSPKEHYR